MILDQAMRAGVGHIGSALSVADILYVLYDRVLRLDGGDKQNRDRFVLSKGHAALALYCVLALKGIINNHDLADYCQDGSRLGVHPEHSLSGIDFSLGSLGHGLSYGAGAALAARLQDSSRRAFVLLSDAEINEGSVWEAVMFAAHHNLANLVAIVDQNGQQALDFTENVLDLEPLAQRWQAFGWEVSEVDGHDIESMAECFESLHYHQGPPHVIIARTTLGKGVSFMEKTIKWHYWSLSQEEYQQALAEIKYES